MATIVPAIIPTSREDLEEKLALLDTVCDEVQIDIVDGIYASPASWPYRGGVDEVALMLDAGTILPDCGGHFHFEIDLMTLNPEGIIDSWISLCADRVTIHAESTPQLQRFLEEAPRRYGYDKAFVPGLLSFGVAVSAQTDIALIAPLVPHISYVQFMGIKTIGRQGEPFDEDVFRRIAAFRRAFPDMSIQVDGGVTLHNAARLIDAGVSRLVIGSAIWKAENPLQAFRTFKGIAQRTAAYP